MKLSLLVFLVLVSLSLCLARRRWRRRELQRTCVTHPRLRDKWMVLGDNARTFLRIRTHQVVSRHKKTVYRYRCVENVGNIYLLRQKNILDKQDGVLCLALTYVADHPHGEYKMMRLIGSGLDFNITSPVIMPRRSRISIASTCDMNMEYENSAFIRRQGPGCKFPKHLQGRWNYTYQHARSFEIWKRNATLHLMSSRQIKFLCDKRDGGLFVMRSSQFVSPQEDAIMCVEFLPTEEDEFYSYQVSRHNSGRMLDGQLKGIAKGKSVYIHVDCDWIGSPARPEFLYP